MPITEQTYRVLYEGLAPLAAVKNLLAREQKSEYQWKNIGKVDA